MHIDFIISNRDIPVQFQCYQAATNALAILIAKLKLGAREIKLEAEKVTFNTWFEI